MSLKPLRDFKEGQKVRYYTLDTGALASYVTPHSDIAEVIYNQQNFHNDVYLGWKPREVALLGAKSCDPNGQYASLGFDRYIGLPPNTLVEDAASVPIKISIDFATKDQSRDGAFCKGCGNFVPMAVANQSDGTFKCYSCRS